MNGALAPLAEREFRLLFAGRTISLLGSAMAPVALAFAVLELTGSKTDLGLVLAARSIPQIAFLLVGGVWADRLSRHHVMVASNVVSGLTQAAVATLLLTGEARVWHLAALAAVNGCASAFFFPASSGIVPQTVPAAALQSANSLLRLGLNSTSISGAALGGLLVAATSPGVALAADSASYGAAALVLARMRLPASLRLAGSTFFGELHDGWREFRSRTWLWAIVLQFAFVNAAWVGAESVLGPVVADEHLGGAAAWGLILAAQSAGFVVGGIVLLKVRPRRILLAATFGMLLTLPVLLALAVPLPVLAVAALAFFAGFGMEVFGVLWETTMQQEIPGEKLSRVYSYDALGSFVLIPIGLAVVGPVADAVGTSETLLLAAGLSLVATIAVLAVDDVRTLRRRGPSREPEPVALGLTPSR